MATCVNINHPQFIDLLKESGISKPILSARVGIWMELNKTTDFPTLEEINSFQETLTKSIELTKKPIGSVITQDESVGICDGTCGLLAKRLENQNMAYGHTTIPDKYANYHAIALTTIGDTRYILNQPQLEFIRREYQKAPLYERAQYFAGFSSNYVFNRHLRDFNQLVNGLDVNPEELLTGEPIEDYEFGQFPPVIENIKKEGKYYTGNLVSDSTVKLRWTDKIPFSKQTGEYFHDVNLKVYKEGELVPLWGNQKLYPRFIEATKENLINEYGLTEEQAERGLLNINKAKINPPKQTDTKKTEIFYQTSQARLVKQDLKRIFDNEIKGRDLDSNEIESLNQRLTQISNRIGDVNYKVRLSKNGNYYIAGYKNAAVTMEDYYSPYANGIFRQITSKEERKANEKLDRMLGVWAKKHGISVETLTNLRKKFPNRFENEALGVSDFMNGLIGLADNRRLDTMAEEISHFAIELLYNADSREQVLKFLPLGAPMNIREAINNVHKTETYAEVKEDYKNVYDNEIDFRKEALAKILAAEIVNEFKMTEELAKAETEATTFWQKFLAAINDFFVWLDRVIGLNTVGRNDVELTIMPLARKILDGDVLSNSDFYSINRVKENVGQKGWTETDVMYQLNKKPLQYKKKIDTTPDAAIKTKKEFLESARFQLTKRLKEFASSEKLRDTAPLEKQIRELSNKIEKEEFNLGVATFVKDAVKELTTVNAKLTDALDPNSDFEFTNEGIDKANGYVDMYDQLFKNIQNITLNDDSFSENDRKEVKELIASALNLIGSGKSKGTALAILASKVNLERANTDSYGNQIDPNFNPEEITETSHEDTTRYRLNVGNFKNAASSIIRLAHKIIFESVSATKRFAAQTAQTLFQTQEVFLTKYKQTDLVEKDSKGNLTGYFIRKYNYKEYYQKMNETKQKIAEKLDLRNDDGDIDVNLLDKNLLSDSELKIYNAMWKEFFDQYSTKERLEVIEQKINKETGQIESFIKVKKGKTTKFIKQDSLAAEKAKGWVVYKVQKTVPNSQFLNKDFQTKMKDPIFKAHYDNVIQKKREAVAKLPLKYRTERVVYMLPAIHKSLLDKLTGTEGDQSSFLSRLKDVGDQALFVDADDTQFGQMDRFNSQVVPVFFTKPMDVNKLSFDVGRSIVLFSEMAENFRNMNKVAPEIGNLQRAVGARNYVLNKKEGAKAGVESVDYATIKNLLEHFVYGQETKEDRTKITFTEDGYMTKIVKKVTGGKVDITGKTISLTKILKQFQNYIRNNNLAFNIPTIVTGFLTATGDKVINEKLGLYTTVESGLWARGEMAKNMPQIISQTGKLLQTNKVHLILQQQQVVQLEKTIGESGRNRFSRGMVNSNPMYAGYAMGDYLIKGNATLAIYDNYRLYNGQFITREQFYRTRATEKGIPYGESNREDKNLKKELKEEWKDLKDKSLYNAYEAVDGALEVKPEFKKYVTEDLLNSVRGKVEYLTTLVDGTMSETDKGSLSRTAYGGFLTMHRGFFFNLVDKKFRGYRGGTTVNYLTEEEEIGDYVASASFISEIGSRLFRKGELFGAFEVWDKLSPARRRGVQRTLLDFIYLTVTGLLSSMLLKLADDDEDDGTLNFAALVATRWALETGIVAKPGELQNILKEPVVGVRVTKELLSIYEAIFNNDPYEKGMYEGKTRTGRLFIKLSPFGRKNIYELQYPKEKLDAMKQIRGSGLLYNEDSEKFDLGKYFLNFFINNVDITSDSELSEENYNAAVDNLSEERYEENSFN